MKRVIYVVLIILWMIIVFGFSGQNGEESSNLSSIITDKIAEIFFKNVSETELEQLMANIGFIVRKLAHFSLYFVGGFLIFGFINTFNIRLKNKIILTIIFGFLYAISDELHQTFVEGRAGQFRDVLIDTSGVICITILMSIINIIIRRKKQNENRI